MMKTNCRSCGEVLPEGQAFCTVCGMRRDEVSETNPGVHCRSCRTELKGGLRFCTHCGAPVQSPAQASSAQAPQLSSQWSPVAAAAHAATSSYIPPPPVTQS